MVTKRGGAMPFVAFGVGLAMSACMPVGDLVSRSPFSVFSGQDGSAVVPAPVLDSQMEDGTSSPIIDGLLNRRSILPEGPYSEVARAVLAANSRAAEADLRAAKLRAEARASNWLPTLGPNVSLTSLGSVVSSLVVEQILFDNGRKRAEREYAKADVEVAAVALAQDTNDRVLTALELYLRAQSATARADVNEAAMVRMERYAYVMSERVRGGVSDPVDHQIVQQKLNQLRANLSSNREAAAGAMAELQAMSAIPVEGISGISDLGLELTPEALSVMKSRAEATRAVAEATAARAGFFPSLTASGSIGSDGSSAGLNAGSQGIGFGMGADIAALDAQKASASARVGQVQEDANRTLASLEAELASLRRQAVQSQVLAKQAADNFDVYAQQQRAGQRAIPDVISVFETKIKTEREAATRRYDVALAELKIAALKGTLVNGEDI